MGPGRDTNVQSRNPQKERPKFLLFFFSLFTLFSDCCIPSAVPQQDGATGRVLGHAVTLTVIVPWVPHPAELSCPSKLSSPSQPPSLCTGGVQSKPAGHRWCLWSGTVGQRLPGWGGQVLLVWWEHKQEPAVLR